MGFAGALASGLTAGIDMLMGGMLTKAKLEVDKDDSRASELSGEELEFQFNPETIEITRSSPSTDTPTTGSTTTPTTQNTGANAQSSTLNVGNVIFDTYEMKPMESVYDKYIKTLEKFVGMDAEKHAPAGLIFTWGKFTSERSEQHQLKVKLDKLQVKYTMFLNDGTPVRCNVTMNFKLGMDQKDNEDANHGAHSPDHAKLVTVRRGQSLADIAAHEYDNPAEWRRIADANNIDDPMMLTPGTKLVVPPIL